MLCSSLGSGSTSWRCSRLRGQPSGRPRASASWDGCGGCCWEDGSVCCSHRPGRRRVHRARAACGWPCALPYGL